MFSILSIINFQYLFDAYPPHIKQGTFLAVVIISLFFIVIALIIKYLLSKETKLRKKLDKYQKIVCNKITNLLLTGSLINLLLIYLRKFRTPYLQIRFILLLWWAILFIWFITIIQYYLVKVPEQRAEDKKRREYEKYLK